MKTLLEKYAHLLVNYSLSIQKGERLLIRSTTLAEPLVREVFRYAVRAGANVEVDLSFRGKERIFYEEAQGEQLDWVSPGYQNAMEQFEAYLYIRAPFNLRGNGTLNKEKVKKRQAALKGINHTYFSRTATRALKRSLCQYPTIANAQEAGMSLEEYEDFVFRACFLHEDDPIQEWLKVRAKQQKITSFLNKKKKIRYKGIGTDLTFSVEGRTWINSDGQTNMPSGEVYTSPVEDSVQGVVHFTYPAIYMGQQVEGVTLWVKDGYIERWEAKQGQNVLDSVFQMPGTRRFGEAAIGTNTNIRQFTKNMLFDEKIGGTVHLAVGQSYLQAGGKNESPIHWDMIADMTKNGSIYADDEKIYENGHFLLP